MFLGASALSDSSGFGMPLGGFELFIAGVVVFFIGGLWKSRRGVRERGHAEHECGSCGYDLRGLDGGVCPECGAKAVAEA